jgi:hypothetical protein
MEWGEHGPSASHIALVQQEPSLPNTRALGSHLLGAFFTTGGANDSY